MKIVNWWRNWQLSKYLKQQLEPISGPLDLLVQRQTYHLNKKDGEVFKKLKSLGVSAYRYDTHHPGDNKVSARDYWKHHHFMLEQYPSLADTTWMKDLLAISDPNAAIIENDLGTRFRQHFHDTLALMRLKDNRSVTITEKEYRSTLNTIGVQMVGGEAVVDRDIIILATSGWVNADNKAMLSILINTLTMLSVGRRQGIFHLDTTQLPHATLNTPIIQLA